MASERYHRQLILKGFGANAQSKLTAAKVLVIGAGGLGCPALQYLAAAGIGLIGIADDDTVALSNLHRQILYTTDDLGKPKAKIAAQRLHAMNPEIKVIPH
ncbi:MAG: molybdopterin biosynthesis protein, partial [Acinetobacter sp.]